MRARYPAWEDSECKSSIHVVMLPFVPKSGKWDDYTNKAAARLCDQSENMKAATLSCVGEDGSLR